MTDTASATDADGTTGARADTGAGAGAGAGADDRAGAGADATTDARAGARAAFLAASDWRDASVEALSGDASFRRYFRLSGGPRPALLMDAPPPQEDIRPFVRVATHLRDMGFSAPELFARDTVSGFLLLEDFGDDTYTRRLAAGGDEMALYTLATDTLIALHSHPSAVDVDVPPYDADALMTEARLLTDWFMPAIKGAPADAGAVASYEDIWHGLFGLADTAAPTLVLRDYHVDNLMCLDARDGVAACGLLDFQDALSGAPAYDLVSLLADARRDVSAAVRDAMMDRYLGAFPDVDRTGFETAAAMLSAQRNCKIIGIFTRLMVRDGKPVYLRHIPRVWRLLERDLQHPALAPMRRWMAKAIPAGQRRIPSFETASGMAATALQA